MKKAGEIFEKYNLIFLLPVIGAFLFTRLFYAGEISYYLHTDELQEAYEALCVARFGTDSTGALPGLFFKGFENGHSALLIYAGALLMKLKPGLFSLKMFRMIPAAGGLFGLVFSYLCAREMTGKKRDGFIMAVLFTCLPLFFVSQRNFVEDFLALSILPAAFFFLIRGLNRSKFFDHLLSGLFFCAILFTCRKTLVFIPVFLVLTGLYLVLTKKTKTAFAALLCLPAAAGFIVLAFVCACPVNAGFGSIPANLAHLKRIFWDDRHDFNVITAFGTIYIFSVPVIITGGFVSLKKVFLSLKNRAFDTEVIIWIFIVTGFVYCLLSEKADTSVSCPLFFAALLLLEEGILFIGENVKFAFPVIVIAFFISLGVLSHYYFVNYNSQLNHSKDHENGIIADRSVGEAVKVALREHPGKGVTVYTGDFEGRNLLIALYAGASPSEYRQFRDSDSFSFGNIIVNPAGETEADESRVYVIDQYEHPELIDGFTSLGWGMMYLKEYTLFFRQ
ncbi:MAG: glycosyltransferase family 39 protein [Lachnospiraceae bacterium]|nr:glycosyltransferase family 39 protein [Lachnospiraceae bacterium]